MAGFETTLGVERPPANLIFEKGEVDRTTTPISKSFGLWGIGTLIWSVTVLVGDSSSAN